MFKLFLFRWSFDKNFLTFFHFVLQKIPEGVSEVPAELVQREDQPEPADLTLNWANEFEVSLFALAFLS